MKFFAFIMAFYLLALSCYPCGDSEECNVKEERKISASSPDQHEHQSEACTPFCSCACCAASAFYQPIMYAKTHALVSQSLKYRYKVEFHSYDFHSVWQPPKIS